MKKTMLFFLFALGVKAFASNVIPVGNDNNLLYYKIGGGSDFALPPVSETSTINLDTNANVGLGYSCGAFNPAISVANTMNDLKESSDNLAKDLIVNATGSIIMMPMYELAKSNPTLYALFNNNLLSAHKKIDVSTKSCQTVKDQISRKENPYQDWGSIAVGDHWKKKLSLTSSGSADINQAKKEIDAEGGNEGVSWVTGKNDSEGNHHAGGKGQPPVHVIADTVKAGYNALLNRDLQNDSAPGNKGNELSHYFPTPKSAQDWITAVVGDQVITTCNDNECKRKQGSVVGQGLLPSITSCKEGDENCISFIRSHLANMATGNEPVTKENLERVSADGVVMSPDALLSIRSMDTTEQIIIINKLAQEVALQRVINKALVAKNILTTGAQVPVIASSHPAQVVIGRAVTNLDNDIRSIVFEGQVRKQMMSDTLSQVLIHTNKQKNKVMGVSAVSSASSLMESGAVLTKKEAQ